MNKEEILKKALQKLRLGEKLTEREARAVRVAERKEKEKLRAEHYGAVPIGLIVEWTGNTHSQLKSKARAHGLPFAKGPVSLPDFFKALAAFLEKAGHRLSTADERLADIRYRREVASTRKVELEVLREEGQWIPREYVEKGLAVLVEHLRNAAVVLNQQYGDDGYEVLARAINEIERDFESYFGTGDDSKRGKRRA